MKKSFFDYVIDSLIEYVQEIFRVLLLGGFLTLNLMSIVAVYQVRSFGNIACFLALLVCWLIILGTAKMKQESDESKEYLDNLRKESLENQRIHYESNLVLQQLLAKYRLRAEDKLDSGE